MSSPSTVVPHAAHPVRGVMFFSIALFLFACLDTSVKYLAQHHPVPLIAWARYIVHLLLMVVLLGPLQGRLLLQTQRTGLSILRAFCLVAITLCMMFALRRLPLAEATSLTFVAPMLAVLLARPLLGERIGRLRAVAVVVGFLGVLLIARPGGSVDVTGFVLVMGVALGSAGYQLLSRVLMRTERTTTLLFYAALAGAGVFSLMLPWSLGGPTPSLLEWGLLIGVGLSGGIGHYCYTRAYRDATVSLLAPLSYLQLVWAALLGWLVFGQYPDGMSLAGMGIIAVSGIVVALESRRRTEPAD
ncbi:DMT family transporter [Uliginosibacterium sp. H1]|uniref:DMT family transporter n=1 Tax=Uliginosibacterium sp. H1 TaxID=3114757 RepID=UPI002E189265|nr:EamA family transporter [Uliginosibacterium sp. H1]